MTQNARHYCRECDFFLFPQPSRIYPDVVFTAFCPHSAHRVETGGYATGGMEACRYFKPIEQLAIIF